jgi:hypothetical protein
VAERENTVAETAKKRFSPISDAQTINHDEQVVDGDLSAL